MKELKPQAVSRMLTRAGHKSEKSERSAGTFGPGFACSRGPVDGSVRVVTAFALHDETVRETLSRYRDDLLAAGLQVEAVDDGKPALIVTRGQAGPEVLVKVEITVKIKDAAQWTSAYGPEGVQKIRADVKSYIGNTVQGAAAWDEVEAEVKYR